MLKLQHTPRFSCSCLALFFLLYVILPSFVLSVFLLLRVGSPRWAYVASLILLAGLALYNRKKLGVGDVLLFFAILLLCHLFAYLFFDLFHDGLAYHQPAVRRIAAGFNPVYDGYMDMGRPPDAWSDQATYFPKATWYFAAALTAFWGDMQLGSVYHLLLIFAVLFFLWDATREETLSKRALWIIACLNPIALTQITGYLVDGVVATLSLVAIFYARLFFLGKPISRFRHFFCILSLSMLFCVKATGFAYGAVILLCIILHRFVEGYRRTQAPAFAKRLFAGGKAMFSLGFRLGFLVFLLVFVWGFAPYVTNVLNGRHIFYPLVRNGSVEQGSVNLETIAQSLYPNAHNRVTRLLTSIASQSVRDVKAAEIKNPLNVSWQEWENFAGAGNIRVAGLGPLFFLILLLSVSALLIFRLRGNGWLLFMLLILLFIQPYAWQMRYVPFLWLFPFACLLSVPDKRNLFLWIPISLAIANISGMFYFYITYDWQVNLFVRELCAPHEGEVALLDQSIIEYDGIFNRYDIRQKYANPEETDFYRRAMIGSLSKSRTAEGVNISFADDLLPVPETPLVFTEESAMPWLKMSVGLMPEEALNSDDIWEEIWITYADKVKFFMSLDREPQGDWELLLTGAAFDRSWGTRRELSILVFINNQQIGVWNVDTTQRTATFRIPQELMEESFRDEMRLVTLMLRLSGVPSIMENKGAVSNYGLQMDGMQIRPCEEGLDETD
jgi:hypothetical protein